MNELFKLIHDVAPTSTTVLIQGANGTGKELIAKALKKTGGNRTHAAQILGISVRTLRNKLNEYRERMEAA